MAIAESTIIQLIANAREQAAEILVQARSEINIAMGAALGLGADDIAVTLPALPIEPPPTGDPGEVPVFTGNGFSDPGLTARQVALVPIPALDSSGSPGVQPTLQIAPVLDLTTGQPGSSPTLTAIPVLNLAGEPETASDLTELPGLDLSGAPGSLPSVIGFVDPGGQPTGAPGDISLVQDVPTVNFDVDVPDAPDLEGEILGIRVPVIVPITIPDAPDYQPPQFTGVSPLDPGSPPTAAELQQTMRDNFDISATMRSAISTDLDGIISRYCPSYSSAMSKIETRLATYLDGGSALSSTVQDTIHARAISKTDAEYRRSRVTISEQAGSMGHSLPGPMLYAALRENDNARRDANSAAARDLMIKIAEMEQANLQFAVTQSANLRVSMLNAAINYCGTTVQINGQAVQYAREVVDSIVKAYDLSAKRADIQCRIYESEARIFEAKLKGALGILEAYQAKVRGLEAQANVDTALVNAYKARIDAVQAEANVYRAQVDGAVARSSLEKLKVELYQARVQAYSAQTNAWSAQWMGYKAAVEGRVAGVQASVEQVKGFTAQSENYRVIIGARSQAIDAVAKSNEAKQKQVSSAVEVYKAKIGARTAQTDGIARTNEALQRSYIGTITAYDSRIKAQATASESIGRSNESASRQYQSATQAFEAVIRARSLLIESIAKTNEANQKQFTSAVEAYRAQVGALADVNKAEIASFEATLDSFRAKANAISERSRADITRYTAAYQAVVSSADLYLRAQHEHHDLQTHRVQALAQLSSSAAASYAGTAQAALSGLNSLVSVADSV